MYVAVMFRNVENTYRNAAACELRACGFLAGCLPFLPWVQDFQPWRSMDKCVMLSRLTELEQLHVELNSEQPTSLHCSSTHYRHGNLAGPGKHARVQVSGAVATCGVVLW